MRNNKGFTLIELMVVVAIIGVLTAVIVPTFGKQTVKAREKSTLAELKSMKSIVDLYYIEKSAYPADSSGGDDYIANVLQIDGIAWSGDNGGITNAWDESYFYCIVDGGYVIYTRKSVSTGEGDNFLVATNENDPYLAISLPEGVEDGSGASSTTTSQ